MKPMLVLYHGGCRDGFAAAWVAHKVLPPDTEFRPVNHGEPAPIIDAIDRVVFVLDFSYPLPDMLQLAGVAGQLVVMDHHKTAEAALVDFHFDNTEIIFDMSRSGAGIASDYFLDKTRVRSGFPPWPVLYVEDRDLWLFKQPHSEEINAYLSVLPFDFAVWDNASGMQPTDVILQGQSVLAKTANYVAEVRKNARRAVVDGHDVPIVNAAHVDISELLGAMAEGEPFSVGWWQRADGMFSYGLRSRGPNAIDVSEIAKKFGGGGHRNAAGFQGRELLF